MSRSYKKAIYKDVGHRKKDYWRVHRRVNNQIIKHFFTSAAKPSAHYWLTDFDGNYFKTIEKYEKQGMSQEEAYYEAIYEHEYDFWWSRMVGNSCREWWEEPECIDAKVLVNDYDYIDYTLNYEFKAKRYTWYSSTQLGKQFIDKLKRK